VSIQQCSEEGPRAAAPWVGVHQALVEQTGAGESLTEGRHPGEDLLRCLAEGLDGGVRQLVQQEALQPSRQL
jgi:hypothetical protein